MSDPLSDVVALLQPSATFSKNGQRQRALAGKARRKRPTFFYCVVLAGSCLLQVDGHAPVTLQADDFVLIPAAHGFSNGSVEPLPLIRPPPCRSRWATANSASAPRPISPTP